MMHRLARFFLRTGGMLVRPRATVAALDRDEGARDGLWLGLLYLVGGHVYPLIEAVATFVAVRNWGGVAMLFSGLGVLLPPILASIVAETVLGSERGHRRGLCLVPLVVVSIVAQGSARAGLSLPWGPWMPALIGVLASAGLAAWIRSPPSPAERGSVPRTLGVVGVLVVGSAFTLGAIDGRRGLSDWSRLGPLPPGEQVPGFRVAALGGGVLTADALVGKISVVTFWATWCGVCVGELRDLDVLADEYAGKPVQFIAVNREGVAPAQARALVDGFARQQGLRHLPFALDDGSMARTFRVGPIPHTVIFDSTGTVRHIHQGRVTSATLRSEIEALLARR